MTQGELERILSQNGWKPVNGKGTHVNYKCDRALQMLTIRKRKPSYRIPDNALAHYRRKTGLELKEVS
jgi:predicted RNA binding protein YcfA (HicA-like mRNA interferase family)